MCVMKVKMTILGKLEGKVPKLIREQHLYRNLKRFKGRTSMDSWS